MDKKCCKQIYPYVIAEDKIYTCSDFKQNKSYKPYNYVFSFFFGDSGEKYIGDQHFGRIDDAGY